MNSPAFAWRDEYALGHAGMDETHREYVDCVNALLQSPEERLPAALDAFAHHPRRHFAEEDLAMRESAYESARLGGAPVVLRIRRTAGVN